MKASGYYALVGIGVLLIGGVIWWGTHTHKQALAPTTPVATSTPSQPVTLTGMSIYTNGKYGFSIFYPGADTATSTFSTYYHLPSSWRFGALPNTSGTSVIAIIGYQTKSDNSYPRYFDAEVRVGVSTDPREVRACLQVGDGEAPAKDLVTSGTTWKGFSFESAGMMQYAKGVSYRTIHDGACFALEQIETGASYRDDAPSSKDISDTVLQKHYADLATIVQSFSFVQP